MNIKLFRLPLTRHFYSLLLCCISLLFLSASAHADGTLLSTTVEYGPVAEATGFASSEPWNPVWHANGSTYFVYVDSAQRAWVAQITNGVSKKVPVDALTDYLVQADGHHRFSIGVDSAGYIHVTGDMHHYSHFTTATITPYPVRYQQKIIMYWKSKLPNDISGGFVYAGGDASTAIPGGGWLLGHFFADNNGVLYYTSQVHAYEDSNNNGQMAVGLYRYDVSKGTWTAIGALVPKTSTTQVDVNPVFYWEDAGVSGGWFQNYQANFKFDSKNRMYFTVTGNTNSALAGANRILFAYSDDNGATWKKANGTVIPGLPLRGIDGVANTADVVADSGATTTFFGATPGIAVDSNFKIGIVVDSLWHTWNGSAWTTNSTQNYTGLPIPNMSYRMPDNSLIFQDANGNKILRAANLDTIGLGYDFTGYKNFTAIDDYSVRTSGTIYGMALNADGTESVLKTTITAAPLPLVASWTEKDIDYNTTPTFGGNAGFLNNILTITSYGISVEYTQDSFHYVYKPMNGDGTITARVTVPDGTLMRSGLMMRETLDYNSKDVGVYLYPKADNNQAVFSYRATIGGTTFSIGSMGAKTTYWLRLVRAGNVFTGYSSADGTTWTQIAQQTVAMNTSIYVGMLGTAYQSRWFMLPTVFDNITAPANACTTSNPTVTLSPSSQTGGAGGSVIYNVSIFNNDPTACSYEKFNLATVLPSGLTGKFAASSLYIYPLTSATTTLTVSSLAATTPGSFAVKATATNDLVNTSAASASGTYVVTSPCAHSQPTVTITPATQTGVAGKTLNYILSVYNNDPVVCSYEGFSLASVMPVGFTGKLTAPLLYVFPKTSASTTLAVTSASTSTAGSYTMTGSGTNILDNTYTASAKGTYVIK